MSLIFFHSFNLVFFLENTQELMLFFYEVVRYETFWIIYDNGFISETGRMSNIIILGLIEYLNHKSYKFGGFWMYKAFYMSSQIARCWFLNNW